MQILIQPPADGFSKLEMLFIKDTLISIYKSVKDPTTRFMVLAHFECGYSYDQIARMVNFSAQTVVLRIKKAQESLKRLKLNERL